MTLQTSGEINIEHINIECGRTASYTNTNLNESTLRTLAGIANGHIAMSHFYGKCFCDCDGHCDCVSYFCNCDGYN